MPMIATDASSESLRATPRATPTVPHCRVGCGSTMREHDAGAEQRHSSGQRRQAQLRESMRQLRQVLTKQGLALFVKAGGHVNGISDE